MQGSSKRVHLDIPLVVGGLLVFVWICFTLLELIFLFCLGKFTGTFLQYLCFCAMFLGVGVWLISSSDCWPVEQIDQKESKEPTIAVESKPAQLDSKPVTPPFAWRLNRPMLMIEEPLLLLKKPRFFADELAVGVLLVLFMWVACWLFLVSDVGFAFLSDPFGRVVVGGFCCFALLWLGLCVRVRLYSYPDDLKNYNNKLKSYNDKLESQKRWTVSSLPVQGHEQFKTSVCKVLDELKNHVPHRYREVLEYFPKAEYTTSERGFSGRSDGLFTVDGSGNNIGQVNTYERFRYVFLHEVGHNVSWYRMKDHSEDAANEYARQVLKEIALAKNR